MIKAAKGVGDAMLSMHAVKTCTGSWTFLLADLKSCISLLPSSANMLIAWKN